MPMAALVAMRVYNAPAISWIDPERAERKPNRDIMMVNISLKESSSNHTKEEGLEVK